MSIGNCGQCQDAGIVENVNTKPSAGFGTDNSHNTFSPQYLSIHTKRNHVAVMQIYVPLQQGVMALEYGTLQQVKQRASRTKMHIGTSSLAG